MLPRYLDQVSKLPSLSPSPEAWGRRESHGPASPHHPQDCFAVVQGGPEETGQLLEHKFDYIFFTGELTASRGWGRGREGWTVGDTRAWGPGCRLLAESVPPQPSVSPHLLWSPTSCLRTHRLRRPHGFTHHTPRPSHGWRDGTQVMGGQRAGMGRCGL